MLDRRHLVPVLEQDRQEGQVGEEDLILGVVDDVAELLGEQPRVQGVADRPDPHDPVPGLDMPRGVPGQRRHPVAALHAESLQGIGQPLGAGVDPAIGRAHDRALDRAADDLAVAVPVPGVVEDLVDRQRPVLHQPKHTNSFPDEPLPSFPIGYCYQRSDATRPASHFAAA
jgi:hypothetical protein